MAEQRRHPPSLRRWHQDEGECSDLRWLLLLLTSPSTDLHSSHEYSHCCWRTCRRCRGLKLVKRFLISVLDIYCRAIGSHSLSILNHAYSLALRIYLSSICIITVTSVCVTTFLALAWRGRIACSVYQGVYVRSGQLREVYAEGSTVLVGAFVTISLACSTPTCKLYIIVYLFPRLPSCGAFECQERD